MNTKIYLIVNALLYIVFGIWCALDYSGTSQAVGFNLPAAQGVAEFVAVYGGLEFGVGAFFLLCVLRPALQLAGILFGTCFYLGIFVFRSYAISQVGFDLGAGINFYIAEGCFTLWSLYLLWSKRNSI